MIAWSHLLHCTRRLSPVVIPGLPGRRPDLVLPQRDIVWQNLRALRSEPPGRARRGDRRGVFSAALEQAEQLFGAAAGAGFASRPLLLFYGLSQAGRAIAAASTTAGKTDWRLSGHGIKVANPGQGLPVRELAIVEDGSGSFTQLARLLDSGSVPNVTQLGQIWMTLPDLAARPLSGVTNFTPALRVEIRDIADSDGRVYGWLYARPRPWTPPVTQQDIDALFSAYPSLAGHRVPSDEGVEQVTEDQGGGRITRTWPWPTDSNVDALARRLTQPYRDDHDRWAFPVIAGTARALHPLIAWWAVLFALSMLARYEPASWTSHLNVDRSQDAVPLESALSVAMDSCPQLILHSIRMVAT